MTVYKQHIIAYFIPLLCIQTYDVQVANEAILFPITNIIRVGIAQPV
jgi:hypothetical protein